jgi:hypothetical protein
MKYPTQNEVEFADRYEICKWHRFLRSPENEAEVQVNILLSKRFKEVGGFTPEISKHMGW